MVRTRWLTLVAAGPVGGLLANATGHKLAAAAIVVAWGLVLAWAVRGFAREYGPSRGQAVRVARLLLAWDSACQGAGCVTHHTREAPIVLAHRPIADGVRLTLGGARGFNASPKVRANLAKAFGASEVSFPVAASGGTVADVVWAPRQMPPRPSRVAADV